jgi:hypothetical protein
MHRLLAGVLVLLVALVGCGSSDEGGRGDLSPSPAPPAPVFPPLPPAEPPSPPPPDDGCDEPFPGRAEVDESVALLVTACSDATGTQLLVRNETAGVLELTSTFPTGWTPTQVGTSTGSQLVSSVLVTGVLNPNQYRLPPEASVVAGQNQPVQLSVQLLAEESALSYSALALGGWLDARGVPRGVALLETGAACVQGLATSLSSLGAPWEDQVRNALQAPGPCLSTLVAALDTGDPRVVSSAADDLVRPGVLAFTWDELVRWAGRVGSLFPR